MPPSDFMLDSLMHLPRPPIMMSQMSQRSDPFDEMTC